MGRFYIVFQPIEILYFTPEVRLICSIEFSFITLFAIVVECVGGKFDTVTVFDNSLTCDKYLEGRIEAIMDPQLMAVDFKSAVCALINKDSRFSKRGPNGAVVKFLQEEDLGLIMKLYCRILALHNFI